jgi:hypothetical protein
MSNVEVVDINDLNDIELSFILAQIEDYKPHEQNYGMLYKEGRTISVTNSECDKYTHVSFYNPATNWDFENDFFKKHCFNLEVGILSRAIIGLPQDLCLLEDEDREKAEQIGETPPIALARAFIYEYIISKNKSVYLPGEEPSNPFLFPTLKQVKFTDD